jgi:hypothetical protein
MGRSLPAATALAAAVAKALMSPRVPAQSAIAASHPAIAQPGGERRRG